MLRRGAGEVDSDRVPVDGDLRVDLELAVDRLEHVARRVAAVRKPRDPGTHDALGIVVELVHRRRDAVAAVARAELVHAGTAESLRSELGAEVSEAFLRVPHLRDEVVEEDSSSRVGGMTTPSSASVWEKAGMLPGSIPPTSAWWARVTANPSAVRETSVMSGR